MLFDDKGLIIERERIWHGLPKAPPPPSSSSHHGSRKSKVGGSTAAADV